MTDAETRIAVVEQAVERNTLRIDAHGREIDQMREMMASMAANDHHRDESLSRIETEIKEQSVKIDEMLSKPARNWDRAAWAAASAAVTALVAYLMSNAGLVY